jgi:hypothetical protein
MEFIYLFITCLTKLPVNIISILGCIVDNEMESLGTEVVVVRFEVPLWNLVEGLSKTTKTIG